jgi:hypothetical protein
MCAAMLVVGFVFRRFCKTCDNVGCRTTTQRTLSTILVVVVSSVLSFDTVDLSVYTIETITLINKSLFTIKCERCAITVGSIAENYN